MPLARPEPVDGLTLWTADAVPELTRDDYRAMARALPRTDTTDRAQYIRAKATGGMWRCPDACTGARGDACECPCARRCHGATYCPGH